MEICRQKRSHHQKCFKVITMNKNIIFNSLQLLMGVAAIVAFFKNWTESFYNLSSIIAFLWTILLITYLLASDSVRQRIYYIIITFIYWEVGYLITGSLLDGLLLGICFSPIVGVLEYVYRKISSKSNK